jgi:RNA polymerase sigma factor (sigma-70 family)
MRSAKLAEQIEKLRPTMVRIAYRILGSESEAQDVAGAIVVRIWKVPPDVQSLIAYASRAARNAAIDRLRARRMEVELGEAHVAGCDVEAQVAARERLRQVQAVLEACSPRMRRVVEALLSGKSYESVALMEGVSAATVRTRLHRLRALLPE